MGKTELLKSYLGTEFDKTLQELMGVNLNVISVTSKDLSLLLQIWDLAGAENFRFLLPVYTKGAIAAIFVYDSTRITTLYQLKEYIDEFLVSFTMEHCDPILIVCGSKIDLKSKIEVTLNDAKDYFRDYKIYDFFEFSIAYPESIQKIFDILIYSLSEVAKKSI